MSARGFPLEGAPSLPIRQLFPGGHLKKKTNINVLEHHLVPKMKVLGENEKSKVLKKYGISEKELPRMLSDDAAAQVLGAKAGDVVEIKREDPTGASSYYRLVV